MQGIVLTLTGPSGSGKTTVTHHLLQAYPSEFSECVSVTTRAKRPGEVEGVTYFYRNPSQFKQLDHAGEFIEVVEYNGNFYGTLRSEISSKTTSGKSTIIIAEPNGARQIRERWTGPLLQVFIKPPTEDTVRGWMAARGDKPEEIEKRVRHDRELFRTDGYPWDAVLVNHTVTQVCEDLRKLVSQFKEHARHATATPRHPASNSPFGPGTVV